MVSWIGSNGDRATTPSESNGSYVLLFSPPLHRAHLFHSRGAHWRLSATATATAAVLRAWSPETNVSAVGDEGGVHMCVCEHFNVQHQRFGM